MKVLRHGAATMLASVLGFAALAPAGALETATLQLNWFPSGDHLALYLAKKRGYYKDEGMELKIVRGFGSADTAQKIELKQAEFGISDTPTVLIARSKGADVKIIGMVSTKGRAMSSSGRIRASSSRRTSW